MKVTLCKYAQEENMMKKLVMILGISSLLIMACGENNTLDAEDTENMEETELKENSTEDFIEQGKEEAASGSVDGEQEETQEAEEDDSLEINSEQPLENIGEYKYTRDGRVELLNIVRPPDTYMLTDGVNINFNDIKIMHYSEIPESEKEFVRSMYGFDDEGHTIQLSYSVENTTDETIGGIEVMDIVTSNGNQYNLYNNGGSLMSSSYEVRPNATTNAVGVVIAIQNPDINGLTLYFQPHDSEGYHLDENSIELAF